MVLWKVAVFPLLSAKICLKIRRTPYGFGYNSWTLWWISKRSTGLTSPCIGLKKCFIIESLSLKPRARTPAASDPCLKGEWTIFIFHQPSLSRHCSALLTGIPAIFFCLNYKIAQLSKKVWPVPVAHREVCLFSIAYNLEKCRETYFLNHSCPVLGIFKFRPRRPYGVKDTFCAPWLDEFRDVGRLKIRQSVRILQTDFRFFFFRLRFKFLPSCPFKR